MMTTDELLRLIEREDDYLLPQELMQQTTEKELIHELEVIFDKYQTRLQEEVKFRDRYLELVNYVFFRQLSRSSSTPKRNPFNNDVVSFIRSLPESA